MKRIVNATEKNIGKLILVTGGVRSGKSLFAERLSDSIGHKVLYLATSEVRDQEMALRVRAHQDRRPSNCTTIEEPIKVKEAISAIGQKYQVVLMDCLTIYISNLMAKIGIVAENDYNEVSCKPDQEKLIVMEIEQLCKVIKETGNTTIIVTNEVGWGIVPSYPLGRLFRDLAGKCNQIVAAHSDEAYLLVAGIPIRMK